MSSGIHCDEEGEISCTVANDNNRRPTRMPKFPLCCVNREILCNYVITILRMFFVFGILMSQSQKDILPSPQRRNIHQSSTSKVFDGRCDFVMRKNATAVSQSQVLLL